MIPQSKKYYRYFTYIQPITKHPIIKNYGHIIFSLITASFFILFAVKPTIETIVVLQKKLADSSNVLRQVNQKTENLSKAKENYDNLSNDVKGRIQAAIPDSLEVHSLIDAIDFAAKAHNASLSAVQAEPVTVEPKVQNVAAATPSEIAFLFNIEGSYPDLIAILTDLRKGLRLITLDKLTFNKSSDDQSLLMSVSGKAYYIK